MTPRIDPTADRDEAAATRANWPHRSPLPPRARASRWWHLAIAVNGVIALVIQMMLVLTGGPDPNTGETVATVGVATRLVQTISFFTIQSNILVLIMAITLVVDPTRDGRFWRILRLDALLGIIITGLVFELVLIHYVHPTGWQLVATIGLHYVAPWATLLGWVMFGPRPRIDRGTLRWVMLWPAAWIAYTFGRGAATHWYPYPFLDVQTVGYGRALGFTAVILVIAVLILALLRLLDRRLRPLPD